MYSSCNGDGFFYPIIKKLRSIYPYSIVFIKELPCFSIWNSRKCPCRSKHSSSKIYRCSISRDSYFKCSKIDSILISYSSAITCPQSSSCSYVGHVWAGNTIIFIKDKCYSTKMRFFGSWCWSIERKSRWSRITNTRSLLNIKVSCCSRYLVSRMYDFNSSWSTQRCLCCIWSWKILHSNKSCIIVTIKKWRKSHDSSIETTISIIISKIVLAVNL